LPIIRFFFEGETIGVALNMFGELSKNLYEMSPSETQLKSDHGDDLASDGEIELKRIF